MANSFIVKLPKHKFDRLMGGLGDESFEEFIESDMFVAVHGELQPKLDEILEDISTVSKWSRDGKVAYYFDGDTMFLFPNSETEKIARWLLNRQEK